MTDKDVVFEGQELRDFADKVRENSKFQLSRIELSEQRDWQVVNGFLSHKTQGFFHIAGFKYEDSLKEELVLYQPQGAFNGLLLKRVDNTVMLLLHARVEPGNSGVVQYGPTIQSTPANYLRLHNGKSTPYLEYFFGLGTNCKPIFQSTQFDLGQRYFQKSKILSYVEINSAKPVDNMVWVPLNTIAELSQEDQLVNTDLRSMIGVFDWERYLGYGEEYSGDFLRIPKIKEYPKGTLVSVNEMKNWEVSDTGVASTTKGPIDVQMFQTKCEGREVQVWTQPLFCAATEGEVVLLTKNVGGMKYYAITNATEFGISGGHVLMPSYTRYPGAVASSEIKIGDLLCSVKQSEEGGRFYQNVNNYEIRQVPDNYELKNNQVWYSTKELKAVLTTSNFVSIQLRCCASLILKDLNPSLSK